MRQQLMTYLYIRNIGNQIDTAMDLVKYGVKYLNTSVLLIIGMLIVEQLKQLLEIKQQT
ncbi:MAG: hypothetical protein RCG15_01060 [Candidatus Rickettsia vulgarisii]